MISELTSLKHITSVRKLWGLTLLPATKWARGFTVGIQQELMWTRHDYLTVLWWKIQRDASPTTVNSYCSSSECLLLDFPCICSALFNEACFIAPSTGDFLQYASWSHRRTHLSCIAQNKSHVCCLSTQTRKPTEGLDGGYKFIITMNVCWVSGRETGLNEHALVEVYWVQKPGWPCEAIQLQKQTSACSYLRFLHLNDPGGRHNDSCMSPKRTRLLNVM